MKMLENLFAFMLPEKASTTAGLIDDIFNVIMAINVVGFIAMGLIIFYFAFKYHRKKRGSKTAYIPENHTLETIWTVVPAIVFVGLAVWGWVVYKKFEYPPKGAYEIQVTGKQWSWEFTYSQDGKTVKTTNDLKVPMNKPVVLMMTSADVVHSFSVPAFRVKKDVVPGMKTRVWFEANKEGKYDAYCTEFCGTAHSKMLAKVDVLPQDAFDSWLTKEAQASTIASPAQLGEKLYSVKGCSSCHTIDGEPDIGPSFKGAFGGTKEFTDNTSAQADENYLRESILNPNAKIVKGFKPKMNSYQGQLTEDELTQLIEFIKSLNK